MKKFLFALLILLNFNCFSQIRIKEIDSNLRPNSPNYSNTITRQIIPFNQNWSFKLLDSEKDGVALNVPATYNSRKDVIFQKAVDFSSFNIKNNKFTIHFLGISYSADILFNDIIIFKKAGGSIPFFVEIPNDLISTDNKNILKVVVEGELDSQISIPLFQRFLFPINSSGITRDVFLQIIPKENVQIEKYTSKIDDNFKSALLNFQLKTQLGSTSENTKYKIEVSISDSSKSIANVNQALFNTELKNSSININISNPKIWTIDDPNKYLAEFKLFKNDSLVDLSKKEIRIVKFEKRSDGIFLNNNKFDIKGVTYIPSDKKFGELISYSELKKDLQIIKGMGINSVRFAKSTPHPFALEICSEIGLIPFIEIPLNSPPKLILMDENFSFRVERFIDEFVKSYSNYSTSMVIGVGSGYLHDSNIEFGLIEKLSKAVHKFGNIITFASFNGVPQNKIDDLDLYGIEIFDKIEPFENVISTSNINPADIFISEATYPNYNGSTNGYLNPFSFEAQARYFENIIDFSNSKNTGGFFLNTMFDFYGDFSSLYTKYDEDNLYSIGILGVDKNVNRTSYNVIKAKITNSQRITIPIGSTKDDSPMFFIVVGLILSILMGVLVNSKKKLREDATRALIRSYNFFADIRDHRIISGVATVFLMLILAGAHSLLIINILYYFRNGILFEKVLLSFGNPSFISSLNYFAWNPVEAFFFFFMFSVLLFLFVSAIILLISFFVKIKIYFTSIFFTVVWAVLPLALLLPIKMVLYRVLSADVINGYIYIFLLVYLLWIANRVVKGIYVIFDISAGKAFLFTFFSLIILLAGFLLYFQISYSTIYYLICVFNQANLI